MLMSSSFQLVTSPAKRLGIGSQSNLRLVAEEAIFSSSTGPSALQIPPENQTLFSKKIITSVKLSRSDREELN